MVLTTIPWIKMIFSRNALLCFVLLNLSSLYCQTASKEIVAGDYKINLIWDNSRFFSGNVEVSNHLNGSSVFKADSIFSSYNWDTLIDLDNSGREELILDLSAGATMYDYNVFLIFDFEKNPIVPLEVHNANLIPNVDDLPKLVSTIRLSPSFLSAGYSYSLCYNNGKLKLETDPQKSKVLRSLMPEDSDQLELINSFKKESDECEIGSPFVTYFEAYLLQMKILNREKKGWKFFDKHYNCNDKNKVRMVLKKSVNENYNYIRKQNFEF